MSHTQLLLNGKKLNIDLQEPIDISLPISTNPHATSAWYVEPATMEPVRANGFLGSVAEGGSVNFRNIKFNPHGNGTHTECVGHIAKEIYSINDHLKTFWFDALLISVQPEILHEDRGNMRKGDLIISRAQIEKAIGEKRPQAVVIRSLPNTEKKKHLNYSNTNPCYLDPEAAEFIAARKIDHLLIDLPSVDREEDQGQLLSHHLFWEYPHNTQFQRTITEFVFIPDNITDGEYALNLMVAGFENDAAPSKPVLYRVHTR